MKCYFAPMEGITGYVYRRAHYKYFPDIDGYFTPFISPTVNHRFTPKEVSDILPEHNQGLHLVPQILTRSASDFNWAAGELKSMGYGEVNLNLGCPSGTVTAKGKGAGFLADPDALKAFLEEIFEAPAINISIKTRLGVRDPDEFYALLDLYNQYPIKELIIHPRIRTDFYKNTPNREMFGKALLASKNPVWYNGDIFTVEDGRRFAEAFPEVKCIMMGRGLTANPGLAGELKGRDPLDKKRLKLFHDEVYHGYLETIQGEKNTLFKMKELWSYMICMFREDEGGGSSSGNTADRNTADGMEGMPNQVFKREKYGKKIRKAANRAEYETAVSAIFRDLELDEMGGYRP